MKWERIPLTEFIWFQRGFDLPKDSFVEGEFPVIGSTSVLGYHNEAKAKGPGIVTGRSGTLGQFQYIESDFWPHNTSLWVKDFYGNDVRFAYYLLHTLDLISLNGGGAVPSLNRNFLASIEVSIPPLPTQRKIAGILSAYDDLIENNLKRIKLLEEKAAFRYKEIVGNEKTKDLKIEDLADVIMGQSPSSETYTTEKDNNIPFHQGVTNFTNYFVENKTYCSAPVKIAQAGDILFSVRAPVGRINFTIETVCIGRGLCAFRSKNGFQNYFYHQLKEYFFEDDVIGNGAIFNAVTKSELMKIKLKTPIESVQMEFELEAGSIFHLILNLTKQNSKLREARDILLPKLMTGQIEV